MSDWMPENYTTHRMTEAEERAEGRAFIRVMKSYSRYTVQDFYKALCSADRTGIPLDIIVDNENQSVIAAGGKPLTGELREKVIAAACEVLGERDKVDMLTHSPWARVDGKLLSNGNSRKDLYPYPVTHPEGMSSLRGTWYHVQDTGDRRTITALLNRAHIHAANRQAAEDRELRTLMDAEADALFIKPAQPVEEKRYGGYTKRQLIRLDLATLIAIAREYGIDPDGQTPAAVVEAITI